MNLLPLDEVALKAEYDLIVETLKKTKFNKAKAADILKVDKKTLYNKIHKYHQYIGSTEQQVA